MLDVFAKLAKRLSAFIGNTIKVRSIDKDELQKFLRSNIESHRQMDSVLSNFSDKEMSDWFRIKLQQAIKGNNNPCKAVYANFLKNLRGKAADAERKRPLGALLNANAAYCKLLEEVSKKIDYLVENESATIFNVRMSFIAILGLLRSSDKVLKFSQFMYSFLTRVESRSATSIPKYRDQYLIDHWQEVSTQVSLILDKKGPYNFLQDVDTMRKRNADVVLGATGRFDFLGYITKSNYTPGFLDNLASALSCLNIFGAALDAWDDYRLARYNRDKETKEWLETHASLLRMDLEGMDKTGPEYKKLIDIIKAYDDKIAEYDKAISDFEKEE